MSIGERVAELRKQHGYTLNTLHQLTGISLSYLSAIENGLRPNPSFRTMEQIARVFHVPLSYFSEELESKDFKVLALAGQIRQLYDEETQAFLVSESSRPYLALVQRLAKQEALNNESELLQTIAQFIREHKQPYPR